MGNEYLQNIKTLVINGQYRAITAAITDALSHEVSAEQILSVMTDAMDTVGERFKCGKIFVPEMFIAAKTMKLGIDVLKPHLCTVDSSHPGSVIIGTVAGDLHDIGKNLVAMMLDAAGFDVIDLGIDVPPTHFLHMAKHTDNLKIVALSALLTTTIPAMEETIQLLNSLPSRNTFKIMVGGVPITQDLADTMGADAYTSHAAAAVEKAIELACANN